jgi:diazepam-binding inhibitor (GABA receptor modulator, acyl-CoA-binding protein)
MHNEDIDIDARFNEAFEKASNMAQDSLPQDVMLRIYAYYKQATSGAHHNKVGYYSNLEIRDAFKINAWIQINHLSIKEAKLCYIDLINEIINKNK